MINGLEFTAHSQDVKSSFHVTLTVLCSIFFIKVVGSSYKILHDPNARAWLTTQNEAYFIIINRCKMFIVQVK